MYSSDWNYNYNQPKVNNSINKKKKKKKNSQVDQQKTVHVYPLEDLLSMFQPVGTEQCCIPKEPEQTQNIKSDIKKFDYTKSTDTLPFHLETIDDLIEIGNRYQQFSEQNKIYNIDIDKINSIHDSLIKLRNMVGLESIKSNIFDILVYQLQGLHSDDEMLHTVIEGPPGVGKTQIAEILAEIYQKLGMLPNNKFIKVKRSDLIGGFLGQTAIKTQQVLDSAIGGVLFIDEAYSLGSDSDNKDNYSIECINAINAQLTEKKGQFVCIIAGYSENLDKCFFAHNSGLKRRFPYRFKIDPYSASELRDIFKTKTIECNWSIEENNDLLSFFEENKDSFEFNGGDMETLLQKCKNVHSKRCINDVNVKKKVLTQEDIDNGFKSFIDNKNSKKDDEDKFISNLYM